MRPQKSKLLLENYFTTDLSCQANVKFDPEKEFEFGLDSLTIESNILAGKTKNDGWQVTLTVFHQATEEVNTPYSFRVEIVGFFKVDATYPANKAEWLVKTNASSVLYSVARETLRRAMQNGPWMSVFLPTVSFYTDETKAELKKLDEKK